MHMRVWVCTRIAGVPFAAVLTAVMFMLAIAQLGPLLVLGSSAAWLYWTSSTGWGTFLLIWTLVAGTTDNFLRPFLIKIPYTDVNFSVKNS